MGGRGQIIKRSETSWQIKVYVGRVDGKRKWKYKTLRGSRADAQKALTKMQRELDTGTYVEPTKLTVEAYLERWLETAARPKVRDNTYIGYADTLRRYVVPHVGQQKLDRLTPLEIQGMLGALQAQGLTARTVRTAHMVLSSALKQAVKWRLLPSNPADYVDKPRQQRKEMLALGPAQVARFMEAAALDRWGVLFAFAIATGMRPSEMFALQWDDVDLDTGQVVVRRALTRKVGGGWHLTPPKTSRSRRTIPLPATVIQQLRGHRKAQLEERLAAGAAYVDNGIVFAGQRGQHLNEKTLGYHLKQILDRAGLPNRFRVYDLRHTCATLLLAANVNPKIVSERLGHSTVVLTLDTYSHVLPTMQRAAADQLEAMLFG